MALWGNKDSKTATGTLAITTAGAVTGSGTKFTTEAKVGNIILASSREYQIVAIASDTSATVISGTNNGNAAMTAVSSGTSYTLSEKPAFVPHESAETVGVSGNSSKVYGVDTGEESISAAKALGVAHSGWVRVVSGSGNRSGRTFTEVLVASGTITGDQADDSTFSDVIGISSQPASTSVVHGVSATFSVTAAKASSAGGYTIAYTTGSALTYQWQIQQSTDDNNVWTDISGATSSSYSTGTGTTVAAGSNASNGDKYRCVIGNVKVTDPSGNISYPTVTTQEALLTVT